LRLEKVPAFELRSQERGIYSAVFTADGRTLVTLAQSQAQVFDKIVCHWDVAMRTLGKTVVIHLPPVRRSLSLRLSPDGQTVALAFYNATEPVSLWDTDTGKKKGTLQGDGTAAQQLAFTWDSRTLATAWSTSDPTQRTVSLWDATTGKRLRRFSIPGGGLDSLQFSPDGRTLAMNGAGPCVSLWDTATGQPRWQREAHEGSLITLSFTPDGRTLVSGSDDGTIRVWATTTGRQVRQLPGHKRGVHAVAVLPDGQRLLSGGYDAVIRLQELQSGEELRRLVLDPASEQLTPPAYSLHALGLAADGRTAASFSYRSQEGPSPELFQVWDMASGQVLVRGSPRSRVYFDSFSPDGELMAGYVSTDKPVESDSPVVIVEEVATGHQVVTLPQPDNGHDGVPVFAPDGRMLATSTARFRRGRDNAYYVDRHAIHLWELLTGKERLTITNNDPGLQFQYTHLAFAPDGRTLATARQDHTLQLWEVATGRELLHRAGYDVDLAGHAFAFAPDARTLATGHADSTILIWDLAPETWQRERRSGPLAVQELMAAWADLASPDARKAHAAIWKLAAVPQQAVPLLRERLHPASAVPADRLGELLNDLNSSQSRQREAALKQLTDLEEQAEPALQDALNGNPSAEQRQRIEPLLTGPRVVRSPEKLRAVRAIQVLEQCNSAEAKQVLTTLAGGPAEARLTQEANATLERLGKRSSGTP
jgi:WD40 repeat protein